jgi:acetylornithine deacetylase
MADCSLLTRELLAQLVGFDTTSRNSNLDLIAFIEDYLAGHGVASQRVDFEAGRKANLLATIGPQVESGTVLSGHTDVVPVDGQDWVSDPFVLDERDGRLYGRGSADMKGFVAVALAMVAKFKAARLKRPIHLAFSCDEEVGCLGVRPLIRHMAKTLPRPAAVIIGEPTSMQVVNAHKAVHTYETEVTGLEAHSSNTHHGVNAIMVAGELLAEINRLAAEMRQRGDPTGRFDPPFTSVHVGTISGGTAKNIVPRRCTVNWEARFIPGADTAEVPARIEARAAALSPAMQAISRDTGIATRRTVDVPGLRPAEGSPAETLALALARANGTGAVSYGTEGGLFQQAGFPTVVCGPGSIDQAHKPDEYVEVAQLAACEAFMGRLVRAMSS